MHSLERRTKTDTTDDLAAMVRRALIYNEFEATDPEQAVAYWGFIGRYYLCELGYGSDDFNKLSAQADQAIDEAFAELDPENLHVS